jgi:hypothetical protein
MKCFLVALLILSVVVSYSEAFPGWYGFLSKSLSEGKSGEMEEMELYSRGRREGARGD